jgi:beta-N-acetylhexosaminidase
MAIVLVVAVIVGFVVVRAVTTPGPSASPSIAIASSSQAPTVAPSPSLVTSASPSPTETAPATPTATVTASAAPPTPTPSSSVPLAMLVGQKLVIRMDGKTPSADLLGRIGRGEVGGVILFGPNVTTQAALVALTAQLSAAAQAGGQPRFIIAVDQEGGSIKRIPWAPPTMSPPEMAANGDPAVARNQGESTGAALAGLGINVDLAPVADVPGTTASFMYKDGRTFSFDAAKTAELSDAFAGGLQSAGVVPSMKHFPGIGFAARNTDVYIVAIGGPKSRLGPGLLPYQTAIGHGIPLIMLSNATYNAYDTANGAGWSPAIVEGLLRGELGFAGVTITDSLDGTAHARKVSTKSLAIRAAAAGTDLLLITGSETTSRGVYSTLLAAAQAGTLSTATLEASYARIIALKAGL